LRNTTKTKGFCKYGDRRTQNSGRAKSENSRLSKRHLHDLRNKIPIRRLIENELGVRAHTESGIFRFECPLCGCFHTSVMKTVNLGRCFECKVNFNPIDMVIAVKKIDFCQSADFLTNILESGVSAKPVAPPARGSSGLVSLSSILSSMAEPPSEGNVDRRIQSLEKKVGEMGKQLDKLQQFLMEILSKRGADYERFRKIDG